MPAQRGVFHLQDGEGTESQWSGMSFQLKVMVLVRLKFSLGTEVSYLHSFAARH